MHAGAALNRPQPAVSPASALKHNGCPREGRRMYEKDLLKGRNIFLTGGGTGLGRSMALRFASLGAGTFLVGRRLEPLESTAIEIRKMGGKCAFTTCDVRDFAAVESAVALAESELGDINTLVNNAAGNFLARTEKLSPNGFN